jgi:hypothetical protein
MGMTKRGMIRVGIPTAVFAAIGILWFTSGIGSNVVASCELRGSGLVDCTVTNHGWAPKTGDLMVELVSQYSPGMNAGLIRIGRLWPSQSVTVESAAPFIWPPIEYCGVPSKHSGQTDWRQRCKLSARFR